MHFPALLALLPKGGLLAPMSMISCYDTATCLTPKRNFTSVLRVFLSRHSCVQSVQPLLQVNLLALHAQVIPWSQFIKCWEATIWISLWPGARYSRKQIMMRWIILHILHCIYGRCKRRQGSRRKGDKMQIFWIFCLKW